MSSLPQVAAALHRCLVEVPTALERSSGYCVRRSKFTGAAFVQTLVLGWLANPAASLHELTVTAAEVGVGIRPQGLDQRFGPAGAALLKGVLEAAVGEAIATEPTASGILARFPAVAVVDSTTIPLPDALADVWVGCGGRVETNTRAAVKVTVRWDLCGGRLEGPELNDGRQQDKATALQRAALPAGALRIGDLGFWSLEMLQGVRAQEAHFLSRLHVQTVLFRADDGTRLALEEWLAIQDTDRLDLAVQVGVQARLPARLLAIRVPPEVAAERRRVIRAAAKREGETPSQRNLRRADWTLVVTSVDADRLSLAEAMVLLRARWQIEQLFKLWKSYGRLDESRSHNPDRILCEVYAKLLAMLVQHWLLITGGWAHADRSLTRLALAIHAYAPTIALHLHQPRALRRILQQLAATLATTTGITKRRTRPATAQFLANPILTGLP